VTLWFQCFGRAGSIYGISCELKIFSGSNDDEINTQSKLR